MTKINNQTPPEALAGEMDELKNFIAGRFVVSKENKALAEVMNYLAAQKQRWQAEALKDVEGWLMSEKARPVGEFQHPLTLQLVSERITELQHLTSTEEKR